MTRYWPRLYAEAGFLLWNIQRQRRCSIIILYDNYSYAEDTWEHFMCAVHDFIHIGAWWTCTLRIIETFLPFFLSFSVCIWAQQGWHISLALWCVKEDNNPSVWEGDLNTDQVWFCSLTRLINQHSGSGLEKIKQIMKHGLVLVLQPVFVIHHPTLSAGGVWFRSMLQKELVWWSVQG